MHIPSIASVKLFPQIVAEAAVLLNDSLQRAQAIAFKARLTWQCSLRRIINPSGSVVLGVAFSISMANSTASTKTYTLEDAKKHTSGALLQHAIAAWQACPLGVV